MALENENSEFEPVPEPGDAPEGWMTATAFANELERSPTTIQKKISALREEQPDWFCPYKHKGRIREHLSPEATGYIAERLGQAQKAPEGYLTTWGVAQELDVSFHAVAKLAEALREEHPEWFGEMRDSINRKREHLHPEAVSHIASELGRHEPAPEGWTTKSALSSQLGRSPENVDRVLYELKRDHPELVRLYKNAGNNVVEHLHPDLIETITERLPKLERAPDGWTTKLDLSRELKVSRNLLESLAAETAEEHPDWVAKFQSQRGRRSAEHFHPDLVEHIRQEISSYEDAPEGWATNGGASRRYGFDRGKLNQLAEEMKADHPEWFQTFRTAGGHIREHYSPEFIDAARPSFTEAHARRVRSQEKARLREEIMEFMEEVERGDTLEAQEFHKLTQLFGSERSLDLLFQLHPEYRKLPVSHVRSVLGEYLGDFYVLRGAFDLGKLDIAQGYIGEPNLRDGLSEVLKDDGLTTYNKIKRVHPEADDRQILEGYTRFLKHETEHIDNPYWQEVIEQADAYYRALFEVQKPDHLVDEIVENRCFPDVNQRINILELARQNKMLIADNMGLGKSASAILAKESLGVEQALVIVPSNVVDTWQKYLSDRRGENGEILGYFKERQAPKILTIDSPQSLRDINPAEYEYVICSQERLTEESLELLDRFDYDMMIVDEVHKLKNLTEGKRAEILIKLTEKINGSDEKYLALLSGTPAPNKVSDIAMLLKLLYPEKFEDWENRDLVNEIINGGDQVGLRSLLLPRMELKELGESIEMPELQQELAVLELSEQERAIYEILLEEDEITATQKMQAMRQFIMNPDLLRSTPSVEGTKIREVGERLGKTFATKDKVVMFVNGYVAGVIEANSKDTTIFDGLDLPDDVRVEIISGSVSKARRREIETDLKREDQKMLVVVSGQTADVGVDLTGPEEVFFYNEPWTEYDMMQQLARVYRPGQEKDVTVRNFYVKGTIEEGIHRYIRAKYIAIEKLLHGIPPSELERELLRKDEKSRGPNLEVNPELAKFYFSKWDNMQEIFRRGKETGEDSFVEHIVKPYGEEYAKGYEQMGRRSYQANVNRLAGSLIATFTSQRQQKPDDVEIIDIASGPEMLRKHVDDELAPNVTSIDINPHHFPEPNERCIVGSYLSLPVRDKSVDYANLAMSLHHTSYRPKYRDFERLKVFAEMNRVLRERGRAVITTNDANDLKNPESFERAIERLGFMVVGRDSGIVESAEGQHFRSRVVTLEKTADCDQDVERLGKSFDKETRDAFKLRVGRGSGLRDSRRIVTKFRFARQERTIRTRLNSADKQIYTAERDTLSRMQRLRHTFGEVESVPEKKLLENGFSRVFNGTRYVLFKSLGSHSGAVVVK